MYMYIVIESKYFEFEFLFPELPPLCYEKTTAIFYV